MKITYDICPRVLGLWGFVFITQEYSQEREWLITEKNIDIIKAHEIKNKNEVWLP